MPIPQVTHEQHVQMGGNMNKTREKRKQEEEKKEENRRGLTNKSSL